MLVDLLHAPQRSNDYPATWPVVDLGPGSRDGRHARFTAATGVELDDALDSPRILVTIASTRRGVAMTA
jgi:hypothetical protein